MLIQHAGTLCNQDVTLNYCWKWTRCRQFPWFKVCFSQVCLEVLLQGHAPTHLLTRYLVGTHVQILSQVLETQRGVDERSVSDRKESHVLAWRKTSHVRWQTLRRKKIKQGRETGACEHSMCKWSREHGGGSRAVKLTFWTGLPGKAFLRKSHLSRNLREEGLTKRATELACRYLG